MLQHLKDVPSLTLSQESVSMRMQASYYRHVAIESLCHRGDITINEHNVLFLIMFFFIHVKKKKNFLHVSIVCSGTTVKIVT